MFLSELMIDFHLILFVTLKFANEEIFWNLSGRSVPLLMHRWWWSVLKRVDVGQCEIFLFFQSIFYWVCTCSLFCRIFPWSLHCIVFFHLKLYNLFKQCQHHRKVITESSDHYDRKSFCLILKLFVLVLAFQEPQRIIPRKKILNRPEGDCLLWVITNWLKASTQ